MKLLDVIEDFNRITKQNNDFNVLTYDTLDRIKSALLQCDEFLNLKELIIVDHPFGENQYNIINECTQIKINEDTQFSDILYLYSLSLTPPTYDPQTVLNPVKNGAVLTPTTYDHETFIPIRKIVLPYTPELANDISHFNGDNRINIHNLLDDILDNPTDYIQKGKRDVIQIGRAHV